MLATLSRMASAEYYLEHTMSMRHPTEYYVGGIEPDGVWFNLNNNLDIENGSNVLPDDFKNLFNGFSPEGDKLTQNSGMEKRASGLDMTFSADKSVSAYWAIAGDKEREIIESSMQEAVAETLEYLSEKGSYCRRGLDGKILEKCDFMAATFLHSTSREMDPQLHIHTAIMNIAFRQDGTTGAIHQPSFYQIYKSLGAISSFKLSQKLNQKLGLNFESYGKDNELRRIKDFPKDLVDLWSKRRKAIIARASELGPLVSSDSKAMATIAVSSRPDKAQDFTREQLLQRFEKEGMDLGYSRDNISEFLSQQVEYNVEKVWENMQKIPAVLSQNDAFFAENKLIDKVYRNADILMSEDEVKSQIPLLLNANKLVRLGMNKTDQEIFTTPEMIFLEKDVSRLSSELIKNAGHKVDEKGIKKVLNDLEIKGVNLSSEQKLALSNSTLNSGSISIIEGAAGSGKSVVLSSISDVFKEEGYKVIGASTTWRVASELGSDCEIESVAIERLLINEAGENKALDQKTVLIVDEAGTLSTEKMRDILQNVQDAGAKVILVGDREQQQPIGAGSGLRLCEEVVGSSRIDQIRRQNVTVEDVLIYKDVINIIDPEVAQLPISLMAKSDKEILAKAFNLELNINGELQQKIITPLSNGEDTYKVVENYADIRGTLTRETARLQTAMMPGEEKQKLLDQYSNEVSKKGEVWQRSASACFKNGEAYKGIEMYYDRGNVKFGKTYSSTIWKMCNEYVEWKAQNSDKTSIIQARTNAEAEDINSALRKIYRTSGVISGDDVEIQVAGKSKGTTDTLTLAKGDVFRFGHRNQTLNVVNGTVGRVDLISQTEKSTRIICDVDGRKIDFLVSEMENINKEIGLKQGYVTTFYSGQGINVDASFQLIDQSLLRENMYSAATRHKNAAHFYINRELALEFVIEKLTEEELQKPIPEKRILEILASKWSVSGQKELAHDYMSDEVKELYQEFYNQLSEGKLIDNLLHADISQREAIREQKVSAQDYTGEDLVARTRVGEFGDLRKDAAEIGEKIRQEIGETGVFYDHKDYGRYLDLRAQADAIASEIYSDIEIHRGGLLNYPNVGDEQLSVAHSRHTARSLVNRWHTAFSENREATADKLASEIIDLVKAEKENGQKPAVKYMAAAIRQSGISNAWDNLYRGHEDHRERHIRETLSGSECLDRDKALDYRRSSINVGRIYGELSDRAGVDLKITEVEGYSKMLSAMKERDRLAVVASDISIGVLKDFNISPEKRERDVNRTYFCMM
ncbi:MobF family relaxase [Kiloniella sp.]|uniref:MobF family relaxase n=1 Tax=Kiloniella sp. TaxID=1938587 RepID=UPI003B019A4C